MWIGGEVATACAGRLAHWKPRRGTMIVVAQGPCPSSRHGKGQHSMPAFRATRRVAIRRIIKWTIVCVTLCITFIYVISLIWFIRISGKDVFDPSFVLGSGEFVLHVQYPRHEYDPTPIAGDRVAVFRGELRDTKWIPSVKIPPPGLNDRVRRGQWTIAFPIWILLLPAIGACVLVFRRRPSLVGKCQGCGYSIAGLNTTQCPECGRAIMS